MTKPSALELEAPRSERLTDGEVEGHSGLAEGDVGAGVDVVGLCHRDPDADAACGKQILEVETLHVGLDLSDSEKGRGAEPGENLEPVLRLRGEQDVVLVLTCLESPDVRTLPESRQRIVGRTACDEAEHLSEG